MTHQFLEKIKPYLFAMTRDYSVIPEVSLELFFTEIKATAEHGVGHYAGGSIEMAFETALTATEHNPGHDTQNLAVGLTLGNIAASAESNSGHDVGFDIEVQSEANISAESHEKKEVIISEETCFAIGIGTEKSEPKEISAGSVVQTEHGIGGEAHGTKEVAVDETLLFSLDATATAMAQEIKNVEDANLEIGFENAITAESNESKEIATNQETEIDISFVAEKALAYSIAATQNSLFTLSVNALRMKYGVVSDFGELTISEFANNKTVDSACLITA